MYCTDPALEPVLTNLDLQAQELEKLGDSKSAARVRQSKAEIRAKCDDFWRNLAEYRGVSSIDSGDRDQSSTEPASILHRVLPERSKNLGYFSAGFTLIRLTIDSGGMPSDPVVLDSWHPKLDELVVQAAMASTYQPATRDGVPVVGYCLYGYHPELQLE